MLVPCIVCWQCQENSSSLQQQLVAHLTFSCAAGRPVNPVPSTALILTGSKCELAQRSQEPITCSLLIQSTCMVIELLQDQEAPVWFCT